MSDAISLHDISHFCGIIIVGHEKMRSEFQFLMSKEDEKLFLTFAESVCDGIEKESDYQWFFIVGDCRIQFLPSKKSEEEISIGRISLVTTGYGLNFVSSEAAENVYKRMRNWLKKTYTNNLIGRNITIEGSSTAYKYFWVGPGALELHKTKNILLKSLPSGPVVFELNESAQQKF